MASPSATLTIPERAALAPWDQWDLAALYASDEAWERDLARLDGLIEALRPWRGRLDSAGAVADALAAETELDLLLERLYVFAHLRADEDTAAAAGQARLARIRSALARAAGETAWIAPTLLAHPASLLREWMETEALRPLRHALIRLLRRQPHILSEAEEDLLARAGEIWAAPRTTFNMLARADLCFPPVHDGRGRELPLSEGRYLGFLQQRDRRLRREAWTHLLEAYGGVRHALAATLATAVKTHNYLARARRYPSARAAALDEDQVPEELYDRLVARTRAARPQFQAYLALRKRRLGLPDLALHDLLVPMVPAPPLEVPYAQACAWVVDACRPLGEDYQRVLRSGLAERWVDVYENRGKQAGAYSSGCYRGKPYVLMNYQPTLEHAFILAHELGHSMHTWLAHRAQPPRYAAYSIFVAEIASLLHEELLTRHLLDGSPDAVFRAYLLNRRCEAFRGAVYRQVLLAEFEHNLHTLDAAGEPLTAERLQAEYGRLIADYHAPEVAADPLAAVEWARIPHFYYNFYVYKYATSHCAAQAFLERVSAGPVEAERYLDLLRAGGSDDPLTLIRRAGVDLDSAEVLDRAFAGFARAVTELDRGLAELTPAPQERRAASSSS